MEENRIMKDVPEEVEEDDEGGEEVWSSRTEPPPRIPTVVLAQTSEEEPCSTMDTYWDPEDFEGIPEPPDGGWGWFIVLASFFCNMVVDGIAYSFGVCLIHIVNYYHSPKGETAWVGSLLSGCYLIVGPLVSALTNKFGCRPVTIAGSIISTIAFLASTQAPNVRVLMVTYGIIGGIGFGLIYLPAIVSVGFYFSTKRAFATGIAVCGSGMGAFVFAPITQMLLEQYDWKGALTILAGLTLNCVVFGSLMRPLSVDNGPRKTKAAEGDGASVSKQSDCGLELIRDKSSAKDPQLNTEPGVQSTLNINEVCSKLNEMMVSNVTEERHGSVDVVVTTDSSSQHINPVAKTKSRLPAPQEESRGSFTGLKVNQTPAPANGAIKASRSQVSMKDFQRRFTMPAVMPGPRNSLYPTANNNYMIPRRSMGRDMSLCVHGGAVRRKKVQDRRDLARPLYRKDIFYSGSIMQLPEYQYSRNDIRSYVASVTSIPCSESSEETGKETDDKMKKKKALLCPGKGFKLPKSMMDTLNEILDFSLLKEPPFLVMCIANIFGMMGFYVPFVYLTDSSVMKGIEQEKAAFLVSILGITNLLGRLLFGWIVDRPRVHAIDVNNICLVVSGIATMTMPFCMSYAAIIVATTAFSLFVAAYISLTSIILVEMVGLNKLTNSFGLLSLFRGAASIIGPPIAGTVFDITGSYDIPFYFAGALLIFTAICLYSIPWINRYFYTVPDQEQFMPVYGDICSEADGGRPDSVHAGNVVTSIQ